VSASSSNMADNVERQRAMDRAPADAEQRADSCLGAGNSQERPCRKLAADQGSLRPHRRPGPELLDCLCGLVHRADRLSR
jgi:hypothetical protein